MKIRRHARGADAGGWMACPVFVARGSGTGRSARLTQLLTERGSLTAALQQHGCVTVDVLGQALARPHVDERFALDGRAQQWRMVREVLLRVDGVPWVFAHTIVNAAAQSLLSRVGGRPLATVLFKDPQVRGMALHYRRINAWHPLFAKLGKIRLPSGRVSDARLFDARRALFVRGRARLLVTEVFLLT